MIAELHCHTHFSSDSRATPEQMIESAFQKGLKTIAITDHSDFVKDDPRIDLPAYHSYITALKNNTTKIEVLLGIELGLQKNHSQKINSALKDYKFDFVIGSMHRAMGMDLYQGEFFKGRTVEDSWVLFLEETLAAVMDYPDFDILGHLDILRRYHEARGSKLPPKALPHMKKLLTWLIENDKGIEINTSAKSSYNLDSFHPQREILQIYKELGGKIVTIGSDAHKPDGIGFGFTEAARQLKEIGFEQLTIFRGRIPDFYKINV